MRHLFIINPAAENIRGREREIIAEIEAFFNSHSNIGVDIYVTRYCRDAVGYIKQYTAAKREPVRIYAVGGNGTLFEVINGAIGSTNIQVACYPFGQGNAFIRYFGKDNEHKFFSLRNLVTANTVPIDVICCENSYSAAFCSIGMEAAAAMLGKELVGKMPVLGDMCYLGAGVYGALGSSYDNINYRVVLDGKVLDGKYLTILVANTPCYGRKLNPAVDAHPNDGHFDVYLVRQIPRLKILPTLLAYTSGRYRQIPDIVKHYTARKLEVSSDSTMCAMMDGEFFYSERLSFEIIPKALDFVCPTGIDIDKIPPIYDAKGDDGN